MTDETKQLIKDVFKSDMKTSEMMQRLVQEHNLEEVSELSVEVVEEMHGKIDEPHREKCLYATCFQIGRAVGNPQLAEFAENQLKKWEEMHG